MIVVPLISPLNLFLFVVLQIVFVAMMMLFRRKALKSDTKLSHAMEVFYTSIFLVTKGTAILCYPFILTLKSTSEFFQTVCTPTTAASATIADQNKNEIELSKDISIFTSAFMLYPTNVHPYGSYMRNELSPMLLLILYSGKSSCSAMRIVLQNWHLAVLINNYITLPKNAYFARAELVNDRNILLRNPSSIEYNRFLFMLIRKRFALLNSLNCYPFLRRSLNLILLGDANTGRERFLNLVSCNGIINQYVEQAGEYKHRCACLKLPERPTGQEFFLSKRDAVKVLKEDDDLWNDNNHAIVSSQDILHPACEASYLGVQICRLNDISLQNLAKIEPDVVTVFYYNSIDDDEVTRHSLTMAERYLSILSQYRCKLDGGEFYDIPVQLLCNNAPANKLPEQYELSFGYRAGNNIAKLNQVNFLTCCTAMDDGVESCFIASVLEGVDKHYAAFSAI